VRVVDAAEAPRLVVEGVDVGRGDVEPPAVEATKSSSG
jgi:hypothetical protein